MKVSDVIGDDARVFTKSSPDRKPKISIVTPTYRRNAEGLLVDCLRSALDQTFIDFEHIIIDDGSSDGTEDVVRRLAEEDERIVYVRHDRNCGLPAVRTNEGILLARGEAIAFLFDDNIFAPDFLEHAWHVLDREGIDLVHGRVRIPVSNGEVLTLGVWPASLDVLKCRNTIANGGVLVRRDFFDRFGLYDPHIVARRSCDWELWIRSLSLGARFRSLPRLAAEERGMISPHSLGNTVDIDWAVSHAYILDACSYRARADRFHPSNVKQADVLDASAVAPYVRNGREWEHLVKTVYRPFLDRHGIPYNPSLTSNRSESVDPEAGWNPSWALRPQRFRILLLTNAVNGLGSLILDSMRTIAGSIALSMPEWALSLLEPGSLDVVVLLDNANPHVKPHILAHRAAGAQVLYISAYHATSEPEDVPADAVPISSNPHLVDFAENPPDYFPYPGYRRPGEANGVAAELQDASDVVLALGAEEGGDLTLPPLPVPSLSGELPQGAGTIAYRLVSADGPSSEKIVRKLDRGAVRQSGETLSSLILSQPGTEIVVEQRDLDALPQGERLAISCLAAVRDVSVRAAGPDRTPVPGSDGRASLARDWQSWFANLVRVLRLRGRLGIAPHAPFTIDIYLNSELYAGSEAYGLLTCKNLSALGVKARIRVPERNVYGGNTIAINEWLDRHGLPAAVRAPYLPSMHHVYRPAGEREEAVERLSSFIRDDPPDLILASGHIPQLIEVPGHPPVFMAFFSAAAYEQTWLQDLHGKLHGIMSDSAWALNPTASIIGAPARVIPSAVDGAGGTQIPRIARGRSGKPVRIAIAGTLQLRKRQLEAVNAVALLRQRGYDVELHLYGFELDWLKDYIASIDAAIADRNLTGHVVRHGFVEDEGEITRDNDIILCASTDESLPQGLVFHMYQGLIGVTVLCGGVDEIVVDGRTGYLTRDPNPAGIADALSRALDDRDNWEAVATAARDWIRSRCGAATVTTALLDLFDEGLALRKVAPVMAPANQAASVGVHTVEASPAMPGAAEAAVMSSTAKAAIRHAYAMTVRGVVYRLKRLAGRSRHVRWLHGVVRRRWPRKEPQS